MKNNTTYNNHSLGGQRDKVFDHFSGTIELYKVLFVIIDGLAITSNLLVIFTILLNRRMRSSIYYLLGNLAFSDLLFAILAPFHITVLVDNYQWHFGAIFCKVYYFLFRTLYFFSMISLVLITVERYMATRYPFTFRVSSKQTMILILASWLFSLIVSLPYVIVVKHVTAGNRSSCSQNWQDEVKRLSYNMFIYSSFYFLPLLVLSFMYAHIFVTLRRQTIGDINDTQRRQLKARKRMSLVAVFIVAAFFICWSPWNIIEFIHLMHKGWNNPAALPTLKNYAVLTFVLSTLVNPVLLNFMCSEFRDGVLLVLCCCKCRGPAPWDNVHPRTNDAGTSTTWCNEEQRNRTNLPGDAEMCM